MPGTVRSILLRLEVRPAGRRCSCAKDDSHVIPRGAPRFVVRERGPAAGEKGYCVECALAMVAKAQEDLMSFQAALKDSA